MATDKADAKKSEIEREAAANAAAIKDVDGTETHPRGNVHSEASPDDPAMDAPAPLPS